MTGHQTIDEKTLEGIALVGRTLGPLFRYDPLLDREEVEALYVALARSDASALCGEWPFVTPDEALEPITNMVRGAKRARRRQRVAGRHVIACRRVPATLRRSGQEGSCALGIGLH